MASRLSRCSTFFSAACALSPRSTPQCRRGVRDRRALHRHGFAKRALTHSRLQKPKCRGVHSDTEDLLSLLLEPDQIDEGPSWLEFHKEVDVALRGFVATGDRPENPQVSGAMTPRGVEQTLTRPLEQSEAATSDRGAAGAGAGRGPPPARSVA